MLLQSMFVLLAAFAREETLPAARAEVTVAAEVATWKETMVTIVAIGRDGPLILAPATEPCDDASFGTGPEQVLTTTVQDAEHPDEPWVVTTYRRPDESEEAFIKRHLDMVRAVRSALDT